MVKINDVAHLHGLGNTIRGTESTSWYCNCIMNEITLGDACLSKCDGIGRGSVCGRTSDACLRTGQSRTLSDDRRNAALERRGIRVPEPTEHHLDERVIAGSIHTPFSYAYNAACNQSEIDFPQNADGQEVALPRLLNPECQEAVP